MDEQAFLCPFCGAPFREMIPLGTIQVTCRYCGGTVLIPPHLGGSQGQCPNHPDSTTVGTCNQCGGTFCSRCVHVVGQPSGLKLYLCPTCVEKQKGPRKFVAAFEFVMGLLFILWGAAWMLLDGARATGGPTVAVLGLFFVLIGLCIALTPPSWPTVYEQQEAQGKQV